MATGRAQRLKVVVELAEQAENDAADIYNRARTQHHNEYQKWQDLRNYCEDYQASLGNTGAVKSVADLARARGFLSQLMQAQNQQERVVDQFLKLAEQKKHLWHKARLKHRAMKDLIERLRSEELQALSRKEEKMLDEWVTASLHRNNNGH